MRITNSMLCNNFLYDLNNNLSVMQKLQQQMSTGNKINVASDDPLGAAKLIELDTEIAQNKQYNTNISNTTDWLNVTDTTLGQASNVLQRINELLVSAGDAAYGPDEQKSIKSEINENISQLSQVINTNYDGKYIFGGTRATDKPTAVSTSATVTSGTTTTGGNTQLDYNVTGSSSDQTNQINQIKSRLTVEIAQGVTMDYSISAGDIMEFKNDSGNTLNLKDILNTITSDLDSNKVSSADGTGLTGADLSNIKDAIANIAKLRTRVGSMENRMTSAKTQNESENTSLTEVLSNTNDVDMAEATIQYSTAQTVYLASLQTSAKIIQPTLLDYLR